MQIISNKSLFNYETMNKSEGLRSFALFTLIRALSLFLELIDSYDEKKLEEKVDL